MVTCPNCGASVESSVCDYCGTFLVNAAVIEMEPGKRFWLKLKDRHGTVCVVDAVVDDCNIFHDYYGIYDKTKLRITFDAFEQKEVPYEANAYRG